MASALTVDTRATNTIAIITAVLVPLAILVLVATRRRQTFVQRLLRMATQVLVVKRAAAKPRSMPSKRHNCRFGWSKTRIDGGTTFDLDGKAFDLLEAQRQRDVTRAEVQRVLEEAREKPRYMRRRWLYGHMFTHLASS